ncbi:MAG TPA: hypothetical protein VK911_10490 [Vicinamibacterales bacterium]|nr:hypothetical protein [Vicinamibacterales bacterium]
MRVTRSVIWGPLVLGTVAIIAACGGNTESADRGSQAPPSAEVVQHMHDHLAQVQTVQQAVIRGDIDEARTAARRFADHQELTGMPENVQETVDDMKEAAQKVGNADDLKSAGEATGTMLAECGSCHRSMSARPNFPSPAAQAQARNKTVAQMLEHQRAMDLLYQGLVAPSDDLWRQGAEALKASPLKADTFPADTELSKEALDAQAETHEVAETAAEAADLDKRGDVYGRLIGGCATCHSLSGRVLGPGVPKEAQMR